MHIRQLVLNAGIFLVSIMCGVSLSVFLLAPATSSAQSTTTLEDQIDKTNSQIKDLQAQIAALQKQLAGTTQQKQTLQNAINALNLNIQKLQKSILLTQAQIAQKNDQIDTLNTSIATTTSVIDVTESQVRDSIRELEAADNQPAIAIFLGGATISSFFDEANNLAAIRGELENKIEKLVTLKNILQLNKNNAQQKKTELSSLQADLTQQKQGLAITRDSQNQLLAKTKNQESLYQAQIQQKQQEQARFEADLLSFQQQLKLKFDASTLPASGQSELQWPLRSVTITQYFGNTDFATKNPQIYSGHGHSGIDLAASPGTPIFAARAGTVLGTGNTDLTCPGASFGKWIFIKHDDGLSTLYAHLSSFMVGQGDTVTAGQLIGYSDTTGYATGPHLHFGVYASAGSEIASFNSSSCKGKVYTMPVGDLTAYLNPLSYLPPKP